MKYRLLELLSRWWCKLPRCWKYCYQGNLMVHYIWLDGRKWDIWEYYLEEEDWRGA